MPLLMYSAEMQGLSAEEQVQASGYSPMIKASYFTAIDYEHRNTAFPPSGRVISDYRHPATGF